MKSIAFEDVIPSSFFQPNHKVRGEQCHQLGNKNITFLYAEQFYQLLALITTDKRDVTTKYLLSCRGLRWVYKKRGRGVMNLDLDNPEPKQRDLARWRQSQHKARDRRRGLD
jgi:hypothetical protein